MCKPKKNLRDCDYLCFVSDNPFGKVLSYLMSLPDEVLSAVKIAFSSYLSQFNSSASEDIYHFVDELRYWKVSSFRWWYSRFGGVSVRFNFDSFTVHSIK